MKELSEFDYATIHWIAGYMQARSEATKDTMTQMYSENLNTMLVGTRVKPPEQERP